MRSTGAIVEDGDYNVEFKIYSALSSSGSSQGSCTGDSACVWTETRTSGNRVRVVNGYLTANLGSVTALPSLNWDQELWISLNIGGTALTPVWDGPMSPRLKLTAVPYAFTAGQLAVTNGSFRSTLGFVQPTANRTIQAPDESGTICLQNSTSCGFALASGGANYIQNQNSSDQTANFRISGTGRANTSFQAPLFDTAAAGTLSIGTTNATGISLGKSTTITGGITQSGGAISLTGNAASSITTSSGNLSLQSGANLSLTVTGANTLNLTSGSAGVIVKPTTDNGAAFQIQNAAGSSIFNVNTVFGLVNIGLLNVGINTNTALVDTTNSGDTISLGTANAGAINIGRSGAAVNIQGNSSSTFKGTSGSFTTTLGFTTPTANRAINLPNESGTVCLQGSSACNFAPTSGSGNYIQNSTVVQSANFNVQAAASGSVAGIIRANATGAGNILNLQNGSGTNVATFSSTGAVTLQNSTNSTSAFQVSASAGAGGNSILRVDSTNERVAIGVISDPIGAKLSVATASSVAIRGYQGGSFDAFQLGNATADFFTVGSTGDVLVKPSTNSVNTLQVQRQNGTQLLGVDTQNSITTMHGGTSQLGTWKQASSIPNSMRYSGSASANGFIYNVGGYENGARIAVSYAQENADGSLGAWQVGTSLPVGVYASSVVTANNYIYVFGGQTGSGVVNTVYYASINPTTGVVGAWNTTTTLPIALGWGSATVANGYVYYAGGYNGTTNVATVYYAQLNAGTGAVGSWTTSGNSLPATRDSGSLTVYNNYLYFVGGVNSSNVPQTNAYYASVNPSTGAVGSWTLGTSIPAPRTFNTTFAANGYLYTIGGQDSSTAQFTTYVAKLNTNGSINTWNTGTSLPSAASQHGMAVSSGRVYIIGGSNGYALSAVYYTSTQNLISVGADLVSNGTLTLQANSDSNNAFQVQNAGGTPMLNVNSSDNVVTINTNTNTGGANNAWTASGVMPANVDGVASVEVNGYTYIFGGYDGTSYLNTVYYAKNSANGTMEAWKSGPNLPGNRAFTSAVAVNGYVYVVTGNVNGSTFATTAYYARVNPDGSLGTWQTSTALPSSANRAYASAVSANGYIYLLGGRGNGAYQSTTYYAKPNADGSISSWSTGTALPALRAQHASISANGYIYVLGGTADGTTPAATSYYASVNASTGAIGAWNTTTALPVANMNLTAASANGYVYAVGGYNGTNVLNTINYATLNADGTIGAWTTSTKSMATGLSFGSALAASNNFLYVLGGYNGFAFLNYVYATSLQGIIALNGNLSVGGTASFMTSNSQSAFQIQNASGGQMFNVDTVNNTITLHGNNSGVLTSWKQTTSLDTATSFAGTTVANGFAYMIGGYGAGVYQSTVQFSRLNPNGTMSTWTPTTALPANRAYLGAASGNGYIYALGGTTGSGSVNTIYVGKQSPDGHVLDWQESSVTLPASMNAISVAVSNGWLYVLGGTTGSPVATTYYAQVHSDGSIGSFNSGTALPTASANGQAVVANGHIYYVGGYNGTSALSNVYYATLDATTGAIGTWSTGTSLPSGHNNFGATVSNGYLYAFKTGSVNYAPLNADGSIGQWTQDANSIPVNYNGISALNYNGYNYVLGGYTGSVGTTGVYYSSGARTYVAGTLDLVGMTARGSGYNDDTGGNGNPGGSLIAGNTSIIGSMQVQGQASFAQGVSVTGGLTVGNDLASNDSVITVASRGFSGIHLLGDMGNVSGEGGGAYVLYAQDAWGVQAISGLVQNADLSPQGDTYTGALGNAFLLGAYNNVALQLGTNSIVRLTVLGNGNVCIGVTTCTKKLGVSGTIGASGTITASTTPDIAETIPAAPDVEAADVIMADPNNTERAIKSNRAYNSAAIGVVSDGTSSFMINARANSPDAPLTGKPVVLAGRVPVKVTSEGGTIRPGDQLTTATKAGYAMKATKTGPTIGTALGFFSGSEGEVLVFVNLGYYDPTPELQGSDSMMYSNLNITGDANVNRLSVTSVSVKGDASIAGDLRVGGNITAGTVVVHGHIITKGNVPTIQMQPAAGEGAYGTISGNDVSGVVTITAGDNVTPDKIAKILFTASYDSDANVVITAIGRDSAAALPYIDYTSKTEFVIGIGQSVPAGTTLKYSYHVIQ